MTPAVCIEDRLVEQPAIALFGELGWKTAPAMEEHFGDGASVHTAAEPSRL